MFTERGELKMSCQRWVSGWRVRQEKKRKREEERLVEAKGNLLFLCQEMTKCKISPSTPKEKKQHKGNKLNFTVDFSNEIQDKTTALLPQIKLHTQCTFCLCLKLKHP